MKIGSAINQFEIIAPAKINLFLEIHGKRLDGFHELETVMSTVNLYDRLRKSRAETRSATRAGWFVVSWMMP